MSARTDTSCSSRIIGIRRPAPFAPPWTWARRPSRFGSLRVPVPPRSARRRSRARRRIARCAPRAARLAGMRSGTLRARCRVGYRDARMIELAQMFASGEIDAAWIEDPATPDDALWEAMLEWPGIGPYAAANIMQLLGRYHRLPL